MWQPEWEEVQKGGNACICAADSFCCTVITNNTKAIIGASLEAQLVKNLPAMQETLIPSLGQEDPLEKG